MVVSCENCRNWEKDMYWSKFQVVHFFTVLPNDPHLQLRLPKKFVKNLKEELQESVVLKGPSGNTWSVGLMRNGGDLFLRNGWQKFVKEHNLKQGEVLFFRYHGESQFDVLMFDQSNSCEKESSYFVRNCNCNQEMSLTERTEREPSPSLEIFRSCVATGRSKKKPEVIDVELQQLAQSRGAKSISAGKRSLVQPTKELALIPVVPKVEEDSSEEYGDLNRAHPVHSVSRRRSSTEAENSRAYELAVGAGASSSMVHFLVQMQKSHLSPRFYVAIPSGTDMSHFPRTIADVTLRFESKTWTAKYYHYTKNSIINGPGWGKFASDNNLKVGDVCLFELCSAKTQSPTVLNVRIFRAVEKVDSLKEVQTSKKRNRG